MEQNVKIDQILAEQREQGHTNIFDVTCELTVKDCRNYFFYTRYTTQRWLLPTTLTLYGIFLILELIGKVPTILYGFVFLAFGVALTAAPIYNWFKLQRLLDDNEERVCLSPAGVYIENLDDNTNALYSWEEIDRFAQNGKLYLFYLDTESAVIIPKAALSAEQCALLEQYAATL